MRSITSTVFLGSSQH